LRYGALAKKILFKLSVRVEVSSVESNETTAAFFSFRYTIIYEHAAAWARAADIDRQLPAPRTGVSTDICSCG